VCLQAEIRASDVKKNVDSTDEVAAMFTAVDVSSRAAERLICLIALIVRLIILISP